MLYFRLVKASNSAACRAKFPTLLNREFFGAIRGNLKPSRELKVMQKILLP